jgi:hypothetical protein
MDQRLTLLNEVINFLVQYKAGNILSTWPTISFYIRNFPYGVDELEGVTYSL